MPKRRFTIAGLIGLVALAGLAAAAITAATSAWAGFWYSATFFALFASLLGVGFGRGTRRVFWAGFAALGWGYMLLQYVPIFGLYLGPRLLAPSMFAPVFERVHPDSPGRGGMGMGGMGNMIFQQLDQEPAGSGMEPVGSMGGGGGFRSLTPTPPQAFGGFGGGPAPPNGTAPASSPDALPNFLAFQRIGMALEALIWATLGGWAARYFAARPPGLPVPPTLTSRPHVEE